MNETEKKIRQVECELLDEEFKKYDLVNYVNEVSVPYLLKVYGDLMRELESERFAEFSDFVLWKSLSEYSDGLSHSLKWVINNPGKKTADKLTYEEKDKKALDLLIWGKQYHSVAQQYVAWSRKMIKVDLNAELKEIEFSPPNVREYYFGLSQDISSKLVMDEYVQSFPNEALRKFYSAWIKEIDISEPPINVDWAKAKSSPILTGIKEFFSKHMIPELNGDTDLGGYTLNDFIHFYSCLYITFDFVTSIEDYIDSKTNHENPFGSNPLFFPDNQIVEFLMYMTGQPKGVVNKIVEDITLDVGKFHSKIISQPIIKTEKNCYILPRIFNRIFPVSLIPNMLTKGNKNDLYSKLINGIEKESLRKVESEINKNKKFEFEVRKEPSLSIGEKRITPDFVLIDRVNYEILIVDYKHFLSPFSAADTYNRLSEIKKGVKQIRHYLNFFNRLRKDNDSEFYNYKCFGLLLFHSPMVLPFKIPDERNIALTDMNTFLKYLTQSKTFDELNSLINDLPDLEVKIDSCSYEDSTVTVEDWNFKWQMFVAD